MSLKLVSKERGGQFDEAFEYAFADDTSLKPMGINMAEVPLRSLVL